MQMKCAAAVMLVAAAVCASGALPIPVLQSPSSSDFPALFDQYRHGDADAAVAAFAKWNRRRVEAEAKLPALMPTDTRAIAALALLHTEAASDQGAFNVSPQAVGVAHYRKAVRLISDLPLMLRTSSDPDPRPFCRNWYILAISLFSRLRNYNGASELARVGRDEFGNDSEFLLATGSVAEARMGSYVEEAQRDLRRAIGLNPLLVEARLRLGRMLFLLGRTEEAQRELERTLTEARQHDHLFAAYMAALFLGQLHEEAKRDEAAKTAYETAIWIYPDGQSAYLGLAHLLVSSGRSAEGWAAARRMFQNDADRKNPGPEPSSLYSGGQFWQAGSRLQALRAWVRR